MTLFEHIVGHDRVKEILEQSINKNLGIHWLLVGPPASARSMILMDIEDNVPGAVLVSGTRLNKEGLLEILRTRKPRFLLIDELDKCGPATLNPLLTLCEHKRIISTTKGDPFDIYLDTVIFATANYLDYLGNYFLSRFFVLHFPEYTEEEFLDICRNVLPKKEKIGVRLAEYIGMKVCNDMDSMDVRQALRVAKLAKNKDEVDRIVELLMVYGPKKWQNKQETAGDVRALNLLEEREVSDEDMQLGEKFFDFMTMIEKRTFDEMDCECPECGRIFGNVRGLRTHYSQAHPNTREVK